MGPIERLKKRVLFGYYARMRLNRFPSHYLSCSQFGEDMVVRHLLGDTQSGFYVDIGAHHPVYYSNTYHFYCRGWRGINVDATPGSMEIFELLRPGDTNVECFVDAAPGRTRDFFEFDSPALNTASQEEADRAIAAGQGKLMARRSVRTVTLTGLLDEFLPPGRKVDLLTVDIEGFDETVLRSHDFTRYRPRVLVFERREVAPGDLGRDTLVGHLREHGYELAAFTGGSIVMQDARSG